MLKNLPEIFVTSLPLHSYDYLKKIKLKQTWRLPNATTEMKPDTEQMIKVE